MPDTAPAARAAAARAEITSQIVAGQPVKAITCRRCIGTGSTVHTWNNFGICRRCGGNGVLPSYTAAQKAALDKRAADHRAAHLIFREAVKALHHTERHLVEDAHMHLREAAPDRFDAMVASLLAGRTPAVLAALATYATEADIYTDWAARQTPRT